VKVRAFATGFGVGLLLCAGSPAAVELGSASYRILGSNLNGGSHPALTSTTPVPAIGSLGSSTRARFST